MPESFRVDDESFSTLKDASDYAKTASRMFDRRFAVSCGSFAVAEFWQGKQVFTAPVPTGWASVDTSHDAEPFDGLS